MKFLQKTFAVFLMIALVHSAGAQNSPQRCGNSGPSICTAGNNLTVAGFSPSYDSLPCVVQGVYYDTVIQVKIPTSAVVSPYGTVTINWVKIDTLDNLPCGLCWATNQVRDSFAGGEQFCIRVSGTSYDAPGQYALHIILSANATAYGFIHETETVNAATVGLGYWARVVSPTGSCQPVDTSSTYVGNTSSDTTPAPSNAVTASGALTFCQGGGVTFTATQSGALGVPVV